MSVWVITGISKGCGRALAEIALAAGHQVVATARHSTVFRHISSECGMI